MIKPSSTKRGVTIFFAMLVIGLLLGIGTSISLLATKQLSLSTLGKQSELAFYSADSGTECILYWDQQNSPSPFATTSPQSPAVIKCNGSTITVCTAGNPGTATGQCGNPIKTFRVTFGSTCSDSIVGKGQTNGVGTTTLESHGYNDCSGIAGYRLERAIRVSY